MLRERIIVVVAALVGVGVWAACIGDDPVTTPTDRGALGQRCFEDNRCLSTLVCTGGICGLDNDAGGGSSSSSSTTSSASSASSSSGTSGSPGTTSSGGFDAGQHELCGNISGIDHSVCPADPKDFDCTATTKNCCVGYGCTSVGCTMYGLQDENPHQCFSSDHCGSAANVHCCISAEVNTVPEVCGLNKELVPKTQTGRAFCHNGPACPTDTKHYELCSPPGGGTSKGCGGAAGIKCETTLFALRGKGETFVRNVNVCRLP